MKSRTTVVGLFQLLIITIVFVLIGVTAATAQIADSLINISWDYQGGYSISAYGTGTNPAGFDTIKVPFTSQDRLVTATFGDLDNDGDKDFITGTQEGVMYYYENTGTPSAPHFGRRALSTLDTIDIATGQVTNQVRPTLVDIDNDGDLDLFVGSRWAYNSIHKLDDIHFYENIGTPTNAIFNRDMSKVPNLELQQTGEFTNISFIDIDNDNDLDLVTMGSDSMTYFENTGTVSMPSFQRLVGANNPFGTVRQTDMLIGKPVFKDFDGDGDFDLYYGTDGGTIKYVENTGTSSTPSFSNLSYTMHSGLDTVDVGQFAYMTMVDITNDGVDDIIMTAFTPAVYMWWKGALSGPSVAFTTSNVSCNGLSDGSIIATASGNAPYFYEWSTGDTLTTLGVSTISSLASGTYTVTVTENGGATVTDSVIINEPTAIMVSIVIDSNVSCNSLSDGGATASVSGGTMPYTYLWSNSATTASITGVTAATYFVTVTDANSCSNTASNDITEPTALMITVSLDSNDQGNGGGATANPTGGTSPYSYLWSNSATTASITGVTAGTYTVTLTDNNGCTENDQITITTGPAVIVQLDSNVSCNGLSDGGATVSVSGGTMPYTYLWNNTATTASITGVLTGNYSVTVTDNNGLTDSASVTITEPGVFVAAIVIDSNVSCNGGMDGGATASASGGTMPYTYLWSNSATTASITGIIAGTYTVTITDANACTDMETTTITEPVIPSSSQVAIACDSYSWAQNGMTYTMSGSYTDTVQNTTGCDSVITLNLSINNSTADTMQMTACDSFSWARNGQMYIASGFYSDTIPTQAGCDSVLVLDLSINLSTSATINVTSCDSYTWMQNGMTYTMTGMYNDTVMNAAGCDSVITLDLTINNTVRDTNAVTACDSYTWMSNNQTYTVSGIYSDTLMASNGCDSISSIDLSINLSTSATINVTSCDSYTWMQNGMIYTMSGMYNDTVMNAAGCDSVITLDLTINPTVRDTNAVTACDSYTWMSNNQTYTMSGIYSDTLMASNGCDSIASIDLTLNISTSSMQVVTSCDSYTWMQNGMIYTMSGMYNDTVMNAAGCDSVITLDLTINPTVRDTNAVTACDSYTWMSNNQTYTMSGIYSDTLMAVNGCDSISSIDLSINLSTSATINVTSCDSYTWMQNGMIYTMSGMYNDTVMNAAGCDSVITLDLTINNTVRDTNAVIACDSYTWMSNNQTYAMSGIYSDTLMAANGCDSIASIDLTLNISTSSMQVATSCDSYTWMQNGMTYTMTGMYNDTVMNAVGCDSVITLDLTINNTVRDTNAVTACDSYTWMSNNQTYTMSGIYSDTLMAVNGCDSIATIELIIDTADVRVNRSGFTLTALANGGSISYQWLDCANGDTAITGATLSTYAITANGSYAVEITQNGCVDTSACINIINVGIVNNEVNLPKLKVYPNPANNKVFIELPDYNGNKGFVELFTLNGQLLRTYLIDQNIVSFDVSEYTEGIYILRFKNSVVKLIVN